MSADVLTSADPHLDNDLALLSALKTVNDDADRDLARYDQIPGSWLYLSPETRTRLEARRDARAVIAASTSIDLARAEQRVERRKARPSW